MRAGSHVLQYFGGGPTPELVSQLERLNKNLERNLETLDITEKQDDEDLHPQNP